MTPLKYYMQDGANRQARAVLCLLQDMTIEESWDEKISDYRAEPKVSRWENCREQGYVVTLRSGSDQLNIAWFEHRNSDSICAITWEESTINAPNIDTADFGGQCYSDKYDVSHSVGCEQIAPMADWICVQLQQWWIAKQKPVEAA